MLAKSVFSHFLPWQTDDKDKSFYIVKTVNPFLTFRTLSSDINDTKNTSVYKKLINLRKVNRSFIKLGSDDTSSSDSSHNAIFFSGSVAFFAKSIRVFKVTKLLGIVQSIVDTILMHRDSRIRFFL
jgi:glycosidase